MQEENILERVKRLCKEKGVSVSQMQNDLGLPQGGVYKWNKHTPSFPALQKMSAYFGKSIDYILDGCEHEEPVDVGVELNKILQALTKNSSTVYNGEPLNDINRQVLIDSVQHTIKMAELCQNA